MAATVRADIGTGASVTLASAEGGIKYNKEDSATASTTPITIPTATGTNYSWYKNLGLNVTTGDATTISNRTVRVATTPTTGLTLWFDPDASYVQSTAPASDNGTTNDAAPSGSYTQITTTAQSYHATGVSASSTGLNGQYCRVALGVSNAYTGGAGTAIALPNLLLGYDEA